MKFASHRRGRRAVPAGIAIRQATRLLNRGRSGALVLGLAAAAAVAVPVSASASASASNDPSPVVGHVYVNDNTKPANTIGAFDRHADGTLTPEAGSPFWAGGAGTGTGLASQGALQFSADGRFLIAVDAGSNQISVLRVHSNGSISLVPGGVVSSRGTLPDSIAVHGDLVYVANSGPATATTPASGLASEAACPTSPGQPRRWPPTPRLVMSCSTAPAPSSSAPRSGPP